MDPAAPFRTHAAGGDVGERRKKNAQHACEDDLFKKDKVKEGDKLLGIIKENGGGDKGASAAGVTLIAGPDKAVLEGDPPPPGEPFNFPNLSRMKRSLDNVWSNSLLKQGGDVRSLLFCGPAPNQGSSHVAVHLAMFLATEFNIKTLFVDAVLNKGKSRRYFSNAGAFPGLAAYFSKGTPLDGLVLESTVPSLYVLPSGGENAPLSAGAVIAKRHTQQARSITATKTST